jgi:putative ABC transport system substrate-binding protein
VVKAAQVLGVQVYVASARNEQELEGAFAALTREHASALLVTADPLFIGKRQQVISLAKHYRIPAIYDRRDFAVDGGLMSYGTSIINQYLQSGRYVGRILKGAQPADLPVMQPTKFEMVVNLKTANTLGLPIPPNILALADEVIE